MIRTWLAVATFARTIAVGVSGCADSSPSCTQQVGAAAGTAHTGGLWGDLVLPNVGSLAESHWIGRPEGDPCSRVPGPTDWSYQAVVHLTPDDAAALDRAWSWQNATTSGSASGGSPTLSEIDVTPHDLAPALAKYIPTTAAWMRSRDYEAALPPSQWYGVFLDAPDRLLLVFALDH